MDPILFLAQEHRRARAGLTAILSAAPDQRGRLWARLERDLRVHEQIEDACLYLPLARDVGGADPTLAGWEWRHTEAVRALGALLSEMDRLEPTDPAWLDRMRQVRVSIESHIREEEQAIWPRVGRVWDQGRREQAGGEMERLRARRLGPGA